MTLLGIVFLITWTLTLWWIDSWLEKDEPLLPEGPQSSAHVTVLMAARNEEPHVLKALKSALTQQTDRLRVDVMLVDDHSTDGTVDAISREITDEVRDRIQVLRLPEGQQGKKQALRYGLEHLQGDFVFQTDADAVMTNGMLSRLVGLAQRENAAVVFGGVDFHPRKGVLASLVRAENLNNQCVAHAMMLRGTPVMASGANMLISKDQWSAYSDSLRSNQPSGDDTFFAQSLPQRQLNGVLCPETFVTTDSPDSWSAFFQQRLRWASKTSAYPSFFAKGLAAWIWLVNLLWLCWSLFALLKVGLWTFLTLTLIVKVTVEWGTHRRWFRRLGVRHGAFEAILLSLVYPLYVVLIGILAMLPIGFTWKGRRYG